MYRLSNGYGYIMLCMLKPWKVTKTTVIHKTPWMEFIEDQCESNGKTATYTYMNRTDQGPLIIPEADDRSLWMVRQYRHPIRKIIWQFPVEGKLKQESWEDAARRGLAEELHIAAQTIQYLGTSYPSPGDGAQAAQFYLAQGLSPLEHGVVPHDGSEIEELETRAFTRPEIDAMIDAGAICDSWTLTALFMYDRYTNNHGNP